MRRAGTTTRLKQQEQREINMESPRSNADKMLTFLTASSPRPTHLDDLEREIGRDWAS